MKKVPLRSLNRNGIKKVQVVILTKNDDRYLLNTLDSDPNKTTKAAALTIFKYRTRSANKPNKGMAEYIAKNLFFNKETFNLSETGRLSINKRLDRMSNSMCLEGADIIKILQILQDIKKGKEKVDDSFSFANRYVKLVGDHVATQIYSAFQQDIKKKTIENLSKDFNVFYTS